MHPYQDLQNLLENLVEMIQKHDKTPQLDMFKTPLNILSEKHKILYNWQRRLIFQVWRSN